MTEVAMGGVTVACLAVLFLELALQARWDPRYFRFGILLFRQQVASTQTAPRLEEDLNLAFERSFWSPLTFRQLGDDGSWPALPNQEHRCDERKDHEHEDWHHPQE